MSPLWQLARAKSLVPKCSAVRANSSDISKGIFQKDIREFESSMPSQAHIPSAGTQTLCRNMPCSRRLSRKLRGLTRGIAGSFVASYRAIS